LHHHGGDTRLRAYTSRLVALFDARGVLGGARVNAPAPPVGRDTPFYRCQLAGLEYLVSSQAAMTSLAEIDVGAPLE
jgi:hypothetical protein